MSGGVRLYQNPRFQVPPAALKTGCLVGQHLRFNPVPKSTDFALEPSGASETVMMGNGLAAYGPSKNDENEDTKYE
jgi:hypothetical protein